MSDSDPTVVATLAPELPPEACVEVGGYATTAAGFEHGLVALAIGRPYWLLPAGEGFQLVVRAEDADAVREQLRYFDAESAGWPPRPVVDPAPPRSWELFTPLVWALLVLGTFRATAAHPGWFAAGTLDATAVLARGEWWRAVTALFLHADLGHLVSNLLSGVFVFAAVLTTMGRARGWLLLLVAAVTGNLAAVALRSGEAYRSVGASTAVFAALGILTGRAVRVAATRNHPHRWRLMAAPLAAGATVLGLFGAGGVQVDVIAHVTGFGAGVLAGLIGTKDGAGGK